jgi:hypothetical protein
MVTFIHQFKHYLLGRKFILRTDHGALKWLYNYKDTQGQLARWIETLAQYNFEIGKRKEDQKVKTTKDIRGQTGARTEKKARGIYIPGEKCGSPSTKKETINNL